MSLVMEKLENEPRLLDTDIETGIWALGITDKSISTDVVSEDLGCNSQSGSHEDDGVDEPGSAGKQFDFIHIRYRRCGLRQDIFKAAFLQTKPGGWIEVVENGASCGHIDPVKDSRKSPARDALNSLAVRCSKAGHTNAAAWIKGQLLNAGFVEVEEKVWSAPPSPLQRLGQFLGAVFNLRSGGDSCWRNASSCTSASVIPRVFVIARRP